MRSALYARTLQIYGFRCFGKAALSLQYPGRRTRGASEIKNVNVLLGDNGGGKSSVLRALAIAALAPILLESGFVAHMLVRRPKPGQPAVPNALLKVEAALDKLDSFVGTAPKKLELLARIDLRKQGNLDRLHLDSTPSSPVAAVLEDDFSPAFFVVGYGATRRVETSDFSQSSARRSRGPRYGRVAGLFEDHVTLRPLQSWLALIESKQPKRFAEVVEQLNLVLPDNIRFEGQHDDEGQYVFLFDGVPIPLSSLSDGYKSFIGWVSDLLGHLTDVAPAKMKVVDVPGIVLVDEIDLHLHPLWQRNVVPVLANAFPKLQFVFTTHSPIVASTVKRENVFVTAVAEDGTATIKQLEERIYGRSMEQLLLSSYFGMLTTKPESFQAEAQVLFEKAASGDSAAALQYVERLGVSAATVSKTEGEPPDGYPGGTSGRHGGPNQGREG